MNRITYQLGKRKLNITLRIKKGKNRSLGGGKLICGEGELWNGWTAESEDVEDMWLDFDRAVRILAILSTIEGESNVVWEGPDPFWLFHDLAHVECGHIQVNHEKMTANVISTEPLQLIRIDNGKHMETEADLVGAMLCADAGFDPIPVMEELRKEDEVNRNSRHGRSWTKRFQSRALYDLFRGSRR